MADYQMTETDVVIRTADSACIPNDPANRDRIEYEAWLEAGGVPDPYVPPPDLPPPPNPNERINQGVVSAVETWNNIAVPEQQPNPSIEALDARVTRLEAAFKAMCQGQVEHDQPMPAFRK